MKCSEEKLKLDEDGVYQYHRISVVDIEILETYYRIRKIYFYLFLSLLYRPLVGPKVPETRNRAMSGLKPHVRKEE